MDVKQLANKVLEGYEITRDEAHWLYQQDLKELSFSANEIRQANCSDGFDLCTIINAKSGACSENCKFCAQSAHHQANVESYPLLSNEEILAQAKRMDEQGVLRYSLVTSGKKLSDQEVDLMCDTVKEILNQTSLQVCVSFGLLNEEQFLKLKHAGVTRVHNNLESSKNFFPTLCTTHSFHDKVEAIKAAQAAGLVVCSGGIMGLGESVVDRIDMAFSLKELGINSVPINLLNPIPGTPLEHNEVLTSEEIQRIAAVYRFILPKASIRLAGGRGLLADQGRALFESGANAAITGDMLTTAGISVETDKALLTELGFQVRRHE